jgi:uncharacterized membrane protein YtjA (UPF0391 family)
MARYATGFLLGAVAAGVVGFGRGEGPAATAGKIAFFTFLCLFAGALMGCRKA